MSFSLGILDQSIVFPGYTSEQTLANTVRLAKIAEELGYDRFWVSEHHDSANIAGPSPETLIAYLLASTSRIAIGSGGVMLQHYSPYKVAENFNVLANLAPGRVELGIGRAPGGLPRSTKALQKGIQHGDSLESKLKELVHLLRAPAGDNHDLPGLVASPLPSRPAPVYLLGTSVSSAELAAELGLPYAFALFINNDPDAARNAFATYRSRFNSREGGVPRPFLALSVIAADTEAEANELASEHKSVRVTLANGQTVNVQSLEQAAEFAKQAGQAFTAVEREADIIRGTKDSVARQLWEISERFDVSDFVFTTIIPDFDKRVRSFELLKEALQGAKA